ncbi:MAG: DNA polymerase I [Phycisphaerae bacterium]|nr:DNA polymerase I [Phycisphaerae bacterium]
MAETLYLIDGHSQIFRAYHALRPQSMTSPTGEPTWGTFVFTNILLSFLAARKPDYVGMAVDGPKAELQRTALYPEYKAHRPPLPEGFLPQEKRIFQIVEALGIPLLRSEGHEADDVLATLAERFGSEDLRVVLVSRDKDLDQLVGPHVVLYDPMKDEILDAAAIESAKGYRPDKAVEVQTLMGDSTDNIPGVPGVGPKTAAKLIAKYGSAEAVLAAADEQTPKLRENLKAAAEKVNISRQLVTLRRDVPIDVTLANLSSDKLHYAKLRPLFEELGFNRLLDRLPDSGEKEETTPSSKLQADISNKTSVVAGEKPSQTTVAADFDYQLIDTPEKLDAVLAELTDVKRLAVDTETTDVRPMWASLVGISLAWRPGHGVYIPVRGPLGAETLDVDYVRGKLEKFLADEWIEKIGHNLKYDRIVLRGAGFPLAGPMFDTMIAAHVLDSSRATYKLDAVSMDFINHHCIPIGDVIGRGRNAVTMDNVPTEIVAPYAAEDADVALRLADVLRPMLQAEGLLEPFEKQEMPLMPVLADMEETGVRVEPETLKRMEVDLSKEADALREQILQFAGRPFNPDSPKQLGEVLFTDLQLPVLKKTKTGPSTDSGVLEELASMCDSPIPALVLDYRRLTKLISTYLKSLGECIHPTTGRVHTSFHQAATATGRLSSSDPNLQNIPIRTEQGRRIRSAFVAEEGCLLLSADYSQVELRMLAHFCRDETLTAAFQADQDIHRIVAAEVFGVPLQDVTPDQRARAKTVNFGIIYGQTGFGLARTLGIGRTEASAFIRKYRGRFPKIDVFLKSCVEQAKNAGYVETIFGRRRKIPGIDAANPQERSAAERLAINSVVQGSAADLIKQAMVNIAETIAAEARPSKMLLQIHDELVFEIPAGQVESERAMIVEKMAGAIELAVPLKVDVGVGDNWMNAK